MIMSVYFVMHAIYGLVIACVLRHSDYSAAYYTHMEHEAATFQRTHDTQPVYSTIEWSFLFRSVLFNNNNRHRYCCCSYERRCDQNIMVAKP